MIYSMRFQNYVESIISQGHQERSKICQMSENQVELRTRIIRILSDYGPWIWNEPAKIFSIVWKDEVKSMMEMDPRLLTAEGFLNGMWRDMVTDPEKIYEVFKELQLKNNNHKSNTLNMENIAEKVPHRVPVLQHLKSGKTLTGLQGWKLFGCYRLSSVINRLNKDPKINIQCTIPEGETHGVYKLIA